jgi:hypothetical protein
MSQDRKPRDRLPRESYVVDLERDAATGIVVREWWFRATPISPAGIEWESNRAFVAYEHHREGGPAVITRDAISGLVISERWLRGGKLHRDDGPAIIERKSDGRVYCAEWYRVGQRIRSPTRPKSTARLDNSSSTPHAT